MAKKRPAKKKSAKRCKTVLPMRGLGPKRVPVLMADPCCTEGFKIFKAGFRAMKDANVRSHLKAFDAALTAAEPQLMDYCVMVWGLQQEERDRMVADAKNKYRLVQIVD